MDPVIFWCLWCGHGHRRITNTRWLLVKLPASAWNFTRVCASAASCKQRQRSERTASYDSWCYYCERAYVGQFKRHMMQRHPNSYFTEYLKRTDERKRIALGLRG